MPSLSSDAEAERFVESADLSEYDLSRFTPVQFEFEAKAATLNMRLPEALFEAVKAKAAEKNMPYARYVRMVLEQAVRH
jgi:predicted DNA binding CopG/RHH family protein